VCGLTHSCEYFPVNSSLVVSCSDVVNHSVLAVYGESEAVRGSHKPEVTAVLTDVHRFVVRSGNDAHDVEAVRTTATAWRVPKEKLSVTVT
jgi:hypothetical protein